MRCGQSPKSEPDGGDVAAEGVHPGQVGVLAQERRVGAVEDAEDDREPEAEQRVPSWPRSRQSAPTSANGTIVAAVSMRPPDHGEQRLP